MFLQPKSSRRGGGIDADIIPPRGFVSATMHLAVMATAQWDGKLVADFAPQSG
jgi:hypothetical protein